MSTLRGAILAVGILATVVGALLRMPVVALAGIGIILGGSLVQGL